MAVAFESALYVMCDELKGEKGSNEQLWVAADGNVLSCKVQQNASFTGPAGVDASKHLVVNKKVTHADCSATEVSLRGIKHGMRWSEHNCK